MSITAHTSSAPTPGPWKADRNNTDNISIISPSNEVIAKMTCSKNFEANANLIVAAPELLKAVELFILHFEEYIFRLGDIPEECGWAETLDEALCAIAKAKGK